MRITALSPSGLAFSFQLVGAAKSTDEYFLLPLLETIADRA